MERIVKIFKQRLDFLRIIINNYQRKISNDMQHIFSKKNHVIFLHDVFVQSTHRVYSRTNHDSMRFESNKYLGTIPL